MTLGNNAPGAPHLPPEIHDQIMDCLCEDRPTLKVCTLVCRQWLNRSRFLLCSAKTILDTRRTVTVLKGLLGQTFQLPLQDVTLRFVNMKMKHLVLLLRGLRHLRCLNLTPVRILDPTAWLVYKRKFSLKSLTIRLDQASLSDYNHALVNILNLFSEVETLDCKPALKSNGKTPMMGYVIESRHIAARQDELASLAPEVLQDIKIQSLKVSSYYSGFLFVLQNTIAAHSLTFLRATVSRWAHLESLGFLIRACGGQLEHLRVSSVALFQDPIPFAGTEQKPWQLLNLSACQNLKTFVYQAPLISPLSEDLTIPNSPGHTECESLIRVLEGIPTTVEIVALRICVTHAMEQNPLEVSMDWSRLQKALLRLDRIVLPNFVEIYLGEIVQGIHGFDFVSLFEEKLPLLVERNMLFLRHVRHDCRDPLPQEEE
ncbi:unnamed protein product [Somion occarium]|uniref:F-box domain-containing protein n=1 Tax=Somion occarium TaxID=3059160 RepID=A0ABP1CEV8_9APHY